MPWNSARVVELEPTLAQSFLPNNLACDGDGRCAFVHGDRVQCTRRIFSPAGRPDFTLAYSDEMDVTGVYWWRGLAKYGRPLLVLATDSSDKSPATVQIWNAWRGTGSRIFRSNFNCLGREEESSNSDGTSAPGPQFVRGLSQASSSPNGQLLFCGSSTGAVYGIGHIIERGGGFEHIFTLRELATPVTALGADKDDTDLLAGADEAGNLIVWRVEEDLEFDANDRKPAEREEGLSGYTVDVVYKHNAGVDYASCVGIRDRIIVAGHQSGSVTFHDLDLGCIVARAVTNTSSVTCLDIYQSRDLVLVCGEDCRATVLGFPMGRSSKPVVHFSLALPSMIVGCALTPSRSGLPGAAMLLWDEAKIVRFEYKREGGKVRKGKGGPLDQTDGLQRSSSKESMTTIASEFSSRRRSVEFSNGSRSSGGSSLGSRTPPRLEGEIN